jgi:hypothetical protein
MINYKIITLTINGSSCLVTTASPNGMLPDLYKLIKSPLGLEQIKGVVY